MVSTKVVLILAVMSLSAWLLAMILLPPRLEEKLASGPVLFGDVTEATGIDFMYENGEDAGLYTPLETVGGGVGLIDYDGDGLLDIFFTGGGYFDGPDKKQIKGRPNRLYKNLGNFKFRDVTQETGLDKPLFYTHGVAVGDYDNDGWPDLLVTGYGRVVLYRNVPGPNGGRIFRDVTNEAGLGGVSFWSTSAAIGDIDGDGFPDLFICAFPDWSWKNHRVAEFRGKTHIPPPTEFPGVRNALFRNNKKGKFDDSSAKLDPDKNEMFRRLSPEDLRAPTRGVSVVLADFDADRKPDIFLSTLSRLGENLLFLNISEGRELAFRTTRAGNGHWLGSRGVDVGDPFGTMRPAVWVSQWGSAGATLLENLRRPPSHPHGSSQVFLSEKTFDYLSESQWGAAFLDIDNHGWQDVAATTGAFDPHLVDTFETVKQKPILLRNHGKGALTRVTEGLGSYLSEGHRGRGLVVGDLDNDGWPDLIITHLGERAAILRNNGRALGNHWLGVKLATADNRDQCGSRVVLKCADRTQARFVKAGGSYLSSSDSRLIFGLNGEERSAHIRVEWANGEPRTEEWKALRADHYHRLVQGQGRPSSIKAYSY